MVGYRLAFVSSGHSSSAAASSNVFRRLSPFEAMKYRSSNSVYIFNRFLILNTLPSQPEQLQIRGPTFELALNENLNLGSSTMSPCCGLHLTSQSRASCARSGVNQSAPPMPANVSATTTHVFVELKLVSLRDGVFIPYNV